ncbi:hypothetical protein PGT21_013200 [Puccinia graminis f. sp. tritici]|uniref:Uncharacterized protein n=1 Tax=Puccinia graminis f. sp. tritici TaxID=56615 RepID=A0A5B0SD84_PUCGR|nr:hypothetical protein PGT21_014035 [Puccinia graminis f. sp. tritici]KAA1085625.1 hypothetical protein PGT21_013200 [Puccinia graminis f. sp. tritici]KAA1136036.1 hypothetical protein PGTUg99_023718 [Puccinia graminis f. sp. tritici]
MVYISAFSCTTLPISVASDAAVNLSLCFINGASTWPQTAQARLGCHATDTLSASTIL